MAKKKPEVASGNLRIEMMRLRTEFETACQDLDRAENGQRAAGVRIRKAMQNIKAQAGIIRNIALEMRDKNDPDVS